MAAEAPAVMVVGEDGAVQAQNAPARQMLGTGIGKLCWDVVATAPGVQGKLPCERGCVRELVAGGVEQVRHTRILLERRPHHLTCVPAGKLVVCTLAVQSKTSPERWQLITSREEDVLRLIAKGQTTAAVAEHLGLSQSTIRTHIEHMFTKLAVKTRAALVAQALRLGLLD